MSKERTLHCWADKCEHMETLHGLWSPEHLDTFDANGTCMLERGHEGPHEFTPDDKIGVSLAPAEEMPS